MMKKAIQIVTTALAAVSVFAITACGYEEVGYDDYIKEAIVMQSNDGLYMTGEVTLFVHPNNADCSADDLSFRLSGASATFAESFGAESYVASKIACQAWELTQKENYRYCVGGNGLKVYTNGTDENYYYVFDEDGYLKEWKNGGEFIKVKWNK
ncbi:MAG: hypothetical protein J6C93_01310 [Clostridia bacterium]|nr:hypothetical protein [Clostridia bacterium]